MALLFLSYWTYKQFDASISLHTHTYTKEFIEVKQLHLIKAFFFGQCYSFQHFLSVFLIFKKGLYDHYFIWSSL